MQSQSKQLHVNVVWQKIISKWPELVANDDSAVVVNHVVASEHQRQIALANEGQHWQPLENCLIQLFKFQKKLQADWHHWVEVVVIAGSVLHR